MTEQSLGKFSLRQFVWTSESEAADTLKNMDVDPCGIAAMLPKMVNLTIQVRSLPCRVANIIKQEMLSLGGDAAVARGSVACSVPATDVLLIGTKKQLSRFIEKVSHQPFGLKALATGLRMLVENISTEQCVLKTNRREWVLGDRTYIVAILNVTPDSFSDGGRHVSQEKAIAQGLHLVAEGADILDIGGESSRPGARPVTLEEELRRVIPVIRGLSGRIAIPISIDTTKAAVAREAVASGAEIINDISSMRFDEQMPSVMADCGAAVVFMHMRGVPESMQQGDLHYSSLMSDLMDFFHERLDTAQTCGILRDHIVIDPGLGFGKSGKDSRKLIRHLVEFKALGRPILTGPSRKSFTGQNCDAGPQDRLEGTAAAVTAAIMNGSHLIRVHDVKAMKRVAATVDAILRE